MTNTLTIQFPNMKNILLLLILLPFITDAQIITTIAGNGTPGYSGDGGPATAALINYPRRVTTDRHGNIYFTEEVNCVVRKINRSGIVSTVVGYGVPGFSGDGGAAIYAQLASPFGLTVDRAGNLYISDYNNVRIRKIDTSGIITTIAGTGVIGYNGDSIAATAAELGDPADLAIDIHGNVLIADARNRRIRRVDAAGMITTIAGTGVGGFSGDGGPASAARLVAGGIATDTFGNIYFSDSFRIRKIDASGIVTTIAGNGTPGHAGDGGPATAATISGVESLSPDDSGNIYFTDDQVMIRKISRGGIISRVAGTGIPGYSGDGGNPLLARLGFASGVCWDRGKRGRILIADQGPAQRVRCVGCDSTLGLAAFANDEKEVITIGPNPNNGSFNLTLPAHEGGALISVVDIHGQTVKELTVCDKRASDIHIDITNMTAGVYMVKIEVDGQVYSRKMVVM